MPVVSNIDRKYLIARQIFHHDNGIVGVEVNEADTYPEEEIFDVNIKLAKPINPYNVQVELPTSWTTSDFVDEVVPNKKVEEFQIRVYWYELLQEVGAKYDEDTGAVSLGEEFAAFRP